MSDQANAESVYTREIAQLDCDLKPAIELSQKYRDQVKASEATLKEAMSVIFDAFRPHYHNRALLKEYCAAKGKTWSEKKYNSNPFLPIVEDVLNLNKTNGEQTNVTQALGLACEQNIKKGGFREWIDNKNMGGIRGASAQFSAARKAKKAQAAAGSEAPWLVAFHEAIRLMRSLTKSVTVLEAEGTAYQRAFILCNRFEDDGKPVGVLELVSSAYTFVAARMVFEHPISEIANRSYLFRDSELGDFEVLFASNIAWTATANGTNLIIADAAGHEIKGTQIVKAHSGLHLRQLSTFKSRTDTVRAQLPRMRGFEEWLATSVDTTRKWSDTQRKFGPRNYTIYPERDVILWQNQREREWSQRKLPTALDFDGALIGFMSANLPFGVYTWARDHELFVVPATHNFTVSRECQIHVKHVQRFCKIFSAHAIEPYCYVAHAHEAESAFVCEASVKGGRFLVAFPTVMNPKGVLRCLADDVDIGPLLDTGVEMSPSTNPSLTHQTPALKPPLAPAAPKSLGPDYSHITEVCINEPHASMLVRQQFGAYITCFKPKDNDVLWAKRLTNFKKQLAWWTNKTDVSIYLNLSGWSFEEMQNFMTDKSPEMKKINSRIVGMDRSIRQSLIANRIKCLDRFYASNHKWAIMLDDDAVLSDDVHHNSSWRIFAEMAVNPHSYSGVDVFFPVNPRKTPWQKDVNGFVTHKTIINGREIKKRVWGLPQNYERHRLNHVFTANTDLKGSMFMVRNFRLAGEALVMPDPTYALHGEDTYFAMLAISMGYRVRRCNNIILREYTGKNDTYFGLPEARKEAMRIGNLRLVEIFKDKGLRMMRAGDKYFRSKVSEGGTITENDHLLYKDDFINNCLGQKLVPLDIPKPR